MLKLAQSLVPWLLGFFLVTNMYLLPYLGKSLRITDALGTVLGLWILWRFATKGLRTVPFIALFGFSMLPLFWGLLAFFADERSTMALSVRWLLAAPWGYALFIAARNLQHRISLVWGLWWGCIANVVVLLLQFYDLFQLTQTIGLAAQESMLTTLNNLSYTARAPGMHGHPNASAAIVSLIVPLSLYLYYTRNARLWVVVVGLGGLAAGTALTLSRAPLLISLVTIVAFIITDRDLKPSLRLTGILALIGLPALYWIGPPGGWQRWLDSGNVQMNSSGRLASSLEAMRIALEHPLGIGWEAGQEAIRNAGFTATHNAFLQIAILYGLLLAVTLTVLLLLIMSQLLVGSRSSWLLEAILAFHLFGLFLWEEHLNNPSFIILASWLVAASAMQLFSQLERRAFTLSIPVRQRVSGRLP